MKNRPEQNLAGMYLISGRWYDSSFTTHCHAVSPPQFHASDMFASANLKLCEVVSFLCASCLPRYEPPLGTRALSLLSLFVCAFSLQTSSFLDLASHLSPNAPSRRLTDLQSLSMLEADPSRKDLIHHFLFIFTVQLRCFSS